MGGQQDILIQNVSKLSPEVQESVYSALKTGRYGSINIYAEERKGEYLQAKQYLDAFFNTPEGRRFGAQEIYRTPYSQLFGQEGRENILTTPTPTTDTRSVTISDAKAARLGIDETTRQTLTKGQLTQIEIASGQYRVTPSGRTYQISPTTMYQDYLSEGIARGKESPPDSIFLKPKEREPKPLKDFFVGETGKQFIGVGVPLTPAFISFGDIQKTIRKTPDFTYKSPISLGVQDLFNIRTTTATGFTARVGAELIPTTPAEVGIIGAAVGTSLLVPITAPIISGTFGGLGVATVLSPKLTVEQRVAGGVVAIAGGAGAVAGGYPYARGLKAQTIGRITGEFKSIKIQPEGFKAVELAEMKIGLIEAGAPARTGVSAGVKLPKTSPLKRGGFGVKPSEKVLFLGEQTVATSQRGLFETGKVIQAKGEFFVTPQEPILKIAETRISRLGIAEVISKPKEVKLGFGIPEKAQIGIETGAIVGRVEKRGAYRIGTGGELEAVKTSPQITVEKKLGVTTMKGQAVDIYGIKTGRGKAGVEFVKREISTGRVTTISTEGIISTLGIGTARITTVTKPSVRISAPSISISTPTITTTTKTPTSILTPTKYISKRTTPITTITTPPITPSLTPPTFPSIIPPRTPPITPSLTPPTFPPITPPRTPTKFKSIQQPKGIAGGFSVFVRRFGKFKTIGTGLSLGKAYQVGTEKVRRGLGATFMIKGEGFRIKTPKGFYVKPTKKGTLFIEKRKYRLDFPSEVRELKLAKSIKL